MKNLPTLGLIIVICLIVGLGLHDFCTGLCKVLFRSTTPASATAQNETTILRKAEGEINKLFNFAPGQSQDVARSLAILAIAEQLKRVADALERR